MAKIYYQSARVRRFVPESRTEIREVIRPAYLRGALNRGKLKPMRLSDCYWELMEEEIDAEFDCSNYWDYLTRDGGLRY